MTDREKLVELITEAGIKYATIEGLADHLLAHGVTVKEPQKPLELEEATGTNKIVWYEQKMGLYIETPCDAVFSVIAGFIELAIVGHDKPMYRSAYTYGQLWRCWAEKPTEEERMAAEWDG
jgi:hypothetical protein